MIKKLKNLLKKSKFDAFLISNPVNIFYITGVEADGTYILVDKDKVEVITNFIYFDDIKSALKIPLQVKMFKNDNFYSFFSKKLKYGFESDFMTFNTYNSFKKNNINLIPGANPVEELRYQKSEDEIKKIKKAVNITDKTFKKLLGVLKIGMKETEVADYIFDFQRSYGSSNNSFDTIAAVGNNASLPHAKCSVRRKTKKNSMLKLDYGATYKHYTSDMSRTVFFGKATQKFKKIYNIVLSAQLKAIEKIKPGVSAADIDKEARDYISSKGYGDRFGHGLGHGVGLNVHEAPRVSSKSNHKLKEGNVITVEPGIYLPGWGGIRIEDIVVVRKEGAEILTKSTKKLIEL
ncbi:MAG: M24 family metallopeptidase [Candidatus Muiribacteriota bacterium]